MSMEKIQVVYEGKIYYRYEDVLKNMFGVDKRGVLKQKELEGRYPESGLNRKMPSKPAGLTR